MVTRHQINFAFPTDNPFGYGSPAQREKQAVKYRAFRAAEAVHEHRVGKLTAQYEDRLVTRYCTLYCTVHCTVLYW